MADTARGNSTTDTRDIYDRLADLEARIVELEKTPDTRKWKYQGWTAELKINHSTGDLEIWVNDKIKIWP